MKDGTDIRADLPSGNGISVGVVVRGTGEQLDTVLGSLAAQSCRPREILVIDVAGLDPVEQTVARFSRSNPDCGFRLVRPPAEDIPVPENAAFREADGEILALTDDGAVPDPGWVASIATVFAGDPTAAAVTGPVATGSGTTLVGTYLSVGSSPGSGKRTLREYTLVSGGAPISNLAVRRVHIEELDGFDRSMPTEARGSDFCARLYAAGHSVIDDPSVRVSASVSPTVGRMLRESLRRGRAHARLLRRHFDQMVRLDVAGRHWTSDSMSLRVWIDLDDPDKKLALAAVPVFVFPWLVVVPVGYLGYLAWSVRQRALRCGLHLRWSEVAGMTCLTVLDSAARTFGRIRGSVDDSVFCL